jgi:hypothetical protein
MQAQQQYGKEQPSDRLAQINESGSNTTKPSLFARTCSTQNQSYTNNTNTTNSVSISSIHSVASPPPIPPQALNRSFMNTSQSNIAKAHKLLGTDDGNTGGVKYDQRSLKMKLFGE